jgi:hypothetical protein
MCINIMINKVVMDQFHKVVHHPDKLAVRGRGAHTLCNVAVDCRCGVAQADRSASEVSQARYVRRSVLLRLAVS